MKKLSLILFMTIILQKFLMAETPATTTISGFVYDAANGEALIGANVFLENTYIGSSTNLSGYYVIAKVPPGQYTLICDYVPVKQNK